MRADVSSDLEQLEDSYRAKKERLGEVLAVAAQRPPLPGLSGEQLRVFLKRYFWQMPAEDVIARAPEDLYAQAAAHFSVGHTRPEGAVGVRAFSLTDLVPDSPLRHRHVVQIVTDDMPFLVDSVTAELTQEGRQIAVVVHPVIVVRRDVYGVLQEVINTSDPAAAPDGCLVESWMHVEIGELDDLDGLHAIEQALDSVLHDVREAVEDWPAMRDSALRIATELADDPPVGVAKADVAQAVELLRWLRKDHFTFLGYREYELDTTDGEDVLRIVPASGRGILRADQEVSTGFRKVPAEARARARDGSLLIITKADTRSSVHRSVYLDYIGVKRFDAAGQVIGERRFIGLFNTVAYTSSVLTVPVIRQKCAEVLHRSGFSPTSHSGKDLLDVLETFPRDELFQATADQLLPVALAVTHLSERRQTRLFLRADNYARFYSALVYLPRDRYTTKVRLRIQDVLSQELGGVDIEHSTHSTESVLTRLYFVVRTPKGQAQEQISQERHDEIERLLIDATRSWEDDFDDALSSSGLHGGEAATLSRLVNGFSEGYRGDFPATTAIEDLTLLESIVHTPTEGVSAQDDPATAAGVRMRLYLPGDLEPDVDESEAEAAAAAPIRFKVYRVGQPMLLSDVLPVLQHMGVDVLDERPYDVDLTHEDGTATPAWVYDFGLRASVPVRDTDPDLPTKFNDGFAAIWGGHAEDDGLNALVLRRGLTWREVSVLRAYVRYLRQGGLSFSKEYVEQVLVGNADISALIVELFRVRFDPTPLTSDSAADAAARDDAAAEVVTRVRAALVDVASLEEDRILSAVLGVVEATLRTNFFQRGEHGARAYVSFKLDPQKVPDLPAPRPFREIWVYSPRVEGVHLRFGAVARGGLRWSDRREDMRTEILGLVKAQMVKNTVIVPTGAKGGFLPKRLPDPTDREAWQAEGIACYQTFIRAMLEITDNRVGDRIVPPTDVVCRDAADPYLVVAADKGTATFSDIANAEAIAAGFWLGDAFASGGSAGYDHKAMGITAKGAWESVKRHFRELGVDTQTEDFTVVGVGDMSGDVFGNGMLLSEHIRLIAAFDHRHIFIDPDPDAAASYAERRRLFELPRSSWADYDTGLISAGGGVWPRTAKSIPVSAEVRAALGLGSSFEAATPAELMTAILLAPVDLLWNGGIGTYVKAVAETDADVGDKANDAIRVNGADLRAKVVGEGGNLGLTQRGRIEYALLGAGGEGGKLNTDAIDNSAGVDTSDHEVNIKILLRRAIMVGDLKEEDRDALLAEMTDEVGSLVLQDNYDQNVALAMEERNSISLADAHRRLIRQLETSKLLDRKIEFLPTDAVLRDRMRTGRALTSPELSVLLAYAKIQIEHALLASDLPDDPAYQSLLYKYFPHPLPERYAAEMDRHSLRREIVATAIANAVVNTAGTTGVFRMMEETGAAADAVHRAQTASRRIYDLFTVFDEVAELDNHVPANVQTDARIEVQRLVERATRWFLRNAPQPVDVVAAVERYRDGVAQVVEHLPAALRGIDRDTFEGRRTDLINAGVPEAFAARIAVMPKAIVALDVVDLGRETGRDLGEIAAVHLDVADRLALSSLLERIIAMPRDDRWRAMARGTLRDDLNAAHAALTAEVLSYGEPGDSPQARFTAWQRARTATQARSMAMLAEIINGESVDLASVVVAVRTVREITG